MLALIAVVVLLLASAAVVRLLRPEGFAEAGMFLYLVVALWVTALGYSVAALDLFGDVRAWSVASLATGGFVLAAVLRSRPLRRTVLRPLGPLPARLFPPGSAKGSVFERTVLALLGVTALLCAVASLTLVVFTAPHNWDSMSYHLARMAYYLQHGNVAYFPADHWAQVAYPKGWPLMLAFSFLMSGRAENLTQTVQFVSYFAAALAVYGITRRIGRTRPEALFSAALFALLIECLMEATTTQNDMAIAAYCGILVYSLLAFGKTGRRTYFVSAAVATALAVGTKSAILMFAPAAAVVAVFVFFVRLRLSLHKALSDALILAVLMVLAVGAMAVPAGYVDNWRRFGRPLGPPLVLERYSFVGLPAKTIAQRGARNAGRFLFDFLALDGLPPTGPVLSVQNAMEALPRKAVEAVGLDLESSDPAEVRAPFRFGRNPVAHEDLSYWGVLGTGLIGLAVLAAALGVRTDSGARTLALAAVAFALVQAFAGPWDPWRGRYFIAGAVLAAPVAAGWLASRRGFVRAYVLTVVLVGCWSALHAVAYRTNSSMIAGDSQPSVFALDRMHQLTRNLPRAEEPLARFDAIVPARAVVAVYLSEGYYEYPLFGKGLTRTVDPINCFWEGVQPIPSDAEYLLYRDGYPDPRPRDLDLGQGLFLRELRGTPQSRQ